MSTAQVAVANVAISHALNDLCADVIYNISTTAFYMEISYDNVI